MIDWQRHALDLRKAGMPLRVCDRMIGQYLGFTSNLANGATKDPPYSAGAKLLELHGKICGGKNE